ncbi:MAG: nicotinate (nicotinamide) nucleotide adenylyltransferase [Phycisphaerae bacterium]|nr:nicotinate (nicotinamide) nucleotide adenylyltransferase [Phycisphaerae bacterium]
MSETLAFFGGTFDPVHCGHLIIARSVMEQARLDRLTFVPAGLPPHKAGAYSAAAHRLAMLKLAVAGHDELAVSDIELARPGRSFTYDTLCALRALHPRAELLWLIGLDMLEDLPRWYRAKELVREFDFLVAMRPPGGPLLAEASEALRQAFGVRLAKKLTARVLPTPLVDISSTAIRARVASGQPIDWLTPPPVAQYVRENGLYRK